MPRVSVLIPSYNLAYCIGRTIESVLAQSFSDFELLIEDDASTDESAKVIAEYAAKDARIHPIYKPANEGQNKTTNNLCKRASGEYIALLAADDVWEPEKLAKQVAYLDATPECGMVFGWPRFVNDADENVPYQDETVCRQPNMTRAQWRKQFEVGNRLFISTSLHRAALHRKIGYFAPDLAILADMEFYVRVIKHADIHVMQEVLAAIRMRANAANLSAPTQTNLAKHSDEMEMVYERHYRNEAVEQKGLMEALHLLREKPQIKKIASECRFMVATPFYEVKGYSPYISSMVHVSYTLGALGIVFEFLEHPGDSYVWRARNSIAQTFLRSNCTHLIFIDSDQGWDLEAFLRLIQADVDIVGCAYPVKNNWEHYGVAIDTNPDSDPPHQPMVDEKTGLIRASKVPTGFMKIKREVFGRLRELAPDNWYWDTSSGIGRKMFNYFGHIFENHTAYGEDISFCKRCIDAGFQIWVEPKATIRHVGVKVWEGNYFKFLCEQPGGSHDPKRIAAAANDKVSSEAA